MQDNLASNNGIVLADWTRSMKRSMLRDMIAVVSRPGILSFAGGLPAPELFPTAQYAEAATRVLMEDSYALQYSPPYRPLIEHIAALMEKRDAPSDSSRIFITTGAQQGLNVLVRLLLNPGGQVLLEEAIYTGVQQAIAPYYPEVITVPTDLETGMDVDAVERILRRGARPAFIYTIPEGHNPLGVTLSASKRSQLVDLARRYKIPIIEDDPYGFLYYDQRPLPPIYALDEQWVFYVGSFSKILAPALRVGWIAAPPALLPQLMVVKEAMDLETSGFTQRAISAFLDSEYLPGHLNTLRRVYGSRRDAMLEALRESFPKDASWTKPASGMFVWVILPDGVSPVELLPHAVEEERVAFIPGEAFSVNPARHTSRCMRLNFSNASEEEIREGIDRLGRVVRSAYTRSFAATGQRCIPVPTLAKPGALK